MRCVTPGISWHDRQRISSVDFQPQEYPVTKPVRQRLASAGDDHHVVIWDVSAAAEHPSAAASSVDAAKLAPTCLADLSRHQNTANVVRWSPDGKLLASGDSDGIIIVWNFSDKEAAPDIFGEGGSDEPGWSETEGPSENWTVFKMLRGHLSDVTSLEFAPCGTLLVSCSTDCSAIVFNVNKGQKVKMLSEHKGWVNGVTWDPLNQYVASMASDRVLRVFNTKGYKYHAKTCKCKLPVAEKSADADEEAEERMVRLFHDDTLQSFYRRLAFSPDGELLVVPSGVIEMEGEAKAAHCTYVFSRMDLAKPVLYLPNREYSVAVRFSPVKYKLRPNPVKASSASPDAAVAQEEKKEAWDETQTLFCLPYRMIYAVATQNTVMLYDTQQEEPFARVSKIHYINLNDLAWSPDGNILVVSSTDGFASLITFKPGELGEVYEGGNDENRQMNILEAEAKRAKKRKSKSHSSESVSKKAAAVEVAPTKAD